MNIGLYLNECSISNFCVKEHLDTNLTNESIFRSVIADLISSKARVGVLFEG